MRTRIILPNRDILVGILQHRSAILVHVQIIRRREDRDHTREVLLGRLAVHRVAMVLCFVAPDHGEEVVALEELADGGVGIEEGTTARCVGEEGGAGRESGVRRRGFVFVAVIRNGVRPEEVTEQALVPRLLEAV